MQEFFHGWRPKVGCVTLLLASTFAAVWIRSLFFLDMSILARDSAEYRVSSFGGSLSLGRCEVSPPLPLESGTVFSYPLVKVPGFGTNSDGIKQQYDPWDQQQMEWHVDWAGFHFGVGTSDRGAGYKNREQTMICPYWSFVIPLTLLSAWLILSNPRKTTAVQTEEAE